MRTLNSNYLAESSDTPLTLSISNIPYAEYDLVVYELPGNSAMLSTTVGTTTYYEAPPDDISSGYVDGNSATPFTYNLATSTDAAAPTADGDYVVFPGLTGSSQSVTIQSLTNQDAEEVNGFQVVEDVPEPPAWSMIVAGIGVGGGIQYMRREKKA